MNLQNHWINNATIAHRGLHNADLPENSMGAFLHGMEKGYPIEIDVHLTKDGQVVIFHDHTTKRMCGVDMTVEESTYEELSKLKLGNSEEKIPLLSDLAKVAKTPILVELKTKLKEVGALEKATYDVLCEYGCEYAVQSFNPFCVKWFLDNAPEVVRGQLSCFYRDAKPGIRRYMLKAMTYNKKAKPHFIAYDQAEMPTKYVTKYCEKNPGTLKLVWTVKSQERQNQLKGVVDSVIFEQYIPD